MKLASFHGSVYRWRCSFTALLFLFALNGVQSVDQLTYQLSLDNMLISADSEITIIGSMSGVGGEFASGDCLELEFISGYDASKTAYTSANPGKTFYVPFPATGTYSLTSSSLPTSTVKRVSDTILQVDITQATATTSLNMKINSLKNPYSKK